MKVVCRQLKSATTGEALTSSPWLTIGREYLVLAIEADPSRGVSFLVEGDQPGPTYWDAALFELAASHVPSLWVSALDESGALTLAPAEWQSNGFWERYFDKVPDAVSVFESARAALLAEEPDPAPPSHS
jgi:hypothetical protein